MIGIFQDLRFALRQLVKDRAAAIAIIVTIALGIGVNTAIFSIVNGVLRPLPAPDPQQIVVVAAETKGDETGFRFTFPYAAFDDIRRQAAPSMDVFAITYMFGGLSTGDKSNRFFYGAVSGNFFSALNIKPLLGRFFEPGEGENAGADLTVILGHAFWQKRFGGDPAVIGRQLRINGRLATIIGVAQKDFHGVFAGVDMDGYMPLRSLVSEDLQSRQFFTNREWRDLTVFARLKPNTTIDQAQASLSAVVRRLADQYPATDRGIGIRVIPETQARPMPLHYVVEAAPFVHFFLLFLAGLVLLLACMNVANILLVRATARQRELAIRATLGSGRWRLIRQMLAESIFLAAIGAVAGTLLGSWTSRLFARSLDLGTDLPVLLDFGMDWRVFAYALIAALVTGIFIGVWPAFRASRTAAAAVLHDGAWGGSGGRQRQRARTVLVVGQVAGSLVLLVSAGLFVRSLRNAEHVELGFDPKPLLIGMTDPHWAGYNAERTNNFYRELGRRVRAWPEVQSASFAFSVPMGYYSAGLPIYRDEAPVVPGEQAPVIGCNFIDGDYFGTMQIPIVSGRTFRESDNENAPLVAIVNQTMASRLWPNEDPIGKRFDPA
jgi:predicted permease